MIQQESEEWEGSEFSDEEEKKPHPLLQQAWEYKPFAKFFFISQLIFIILFGAMVEYGDNAKGVQGVSAYKNDDPYEKQVDNFQYIKFQDVHVMVIFGLGFLYTFLERLTHCGSGYTMLIAVLCAQMHILVNGWLYWNAPTTQCLNGNVTIVAIAEEKKGWIQLNLAAIVEADAGAFATLVSYGAVLGLLSPIQLTVMSMIEIILYSVNAWVCQRHLDLVDEGGSILIHFFGAIFGLAVSRTINRKYMRDQELKVSSSESDTFALMGMTFLWILWPSFNARNLEGPRQSLAIANTRWSIAGSAMSALMTSKLTNGVGHFDMFQVQAACLAGGVAMGALCSIKIGVWAAILVGVVAGIIVTWSQGYVVPFFNKSVRTIDARGVSSLHALAGLIGAIGSGIFPAYMGWAQYAPHRFEMYPAMNPILNEANCRQNPTQVFGAGLTGTEQGGRQFISLIFTLGIALVGGLITGAIIRQPIWQQPDVDQIFDDEDFWILEGENEKYQRFVQRMLNRFLSKPLKGDRKTKRFEDAWNTEAWHEP